MLFLCSLVFSAHLYGHEFPVDFKTGFESISPSAIPIGLRVKSPEPVKSGEFSLASELRKNEIIISKGTGFFHIGKDPADSKIAFQLFGQKAGKFTLALSFYPIKYTRGAEKIAYPSVKLEYKGEVVAGQWKGFNLSLTDFTVVSGKLEIGMSPYLLSFVSSSKIYLDDLAMTTLSDETYLNTLPRNINKSDAYKKNTATLSIKVSRKGKEGVTPCLVFFKSPSRPRVPDGELQYGRDGRRTHSFSDGESTYQLEAGNIEIRVEKGVEYSPQIKYVNLKAGDKKEVTFELSKWKDFTAEGFYGGDSHIHANYVAPFSKYIITPKDVKLIGKAEDLHVLNGNVSTGEFSTVYDWEYFTGGLHPLSDEETLIYWNEEYRSDPYGHICFWNLKELIYPTHSGFGHWRARGGYDFPTNDVIIDKVHKQGGVVTYPHPFTKRNTMAASFHAPFTTRELPIDASLGKVDAMDIIMRRYSASVVTHWWRLLNCHIKLTASAGTDAFLGGGRRMGLGRVYAKCDKDFNYEAWIESYKAGKTFVAKGPVYAWMSVDDKDPGETIDISGGKSKTLKIKINAAAMNGVHRIDVVSMGEVVASKTFDNKPKEVTFEHEMTVSTSNWISAQVFGRHKDVDEWMVEYATITPVYVKGDSPHPKAHESAAYFIKWIDMMRTYLTKRNKFGAEGNKEKVFKVLKKSEDYYQSLVKP